jgi:hypothetical protein
LRIPGAGGVFVTGIEHLVTKDPEMRPVLRSLSAIAAVGVALAGCTDRPTSEVTAPQAPITPKAAITALALSCDFTALKASARAYAASNKDVLFTIIGDLQAAYKKGPSAAATDKAFDGIARLAAMRGTSAQNATATGAAFNSTTTGFFGCMESYVTANVPSDFSVANALGPNWMYEVRGKSDVDPSAGAYERGASPTYWAAEAPAGWTASIAASSQAKRFLIYGYRLPDFLPNDPKVGSAFEIKTIPAIGAGVLTFSSPLNIGVCTIDLTPTMRVQHINTILLKKDLACSGPPGFVDAGHTSSTFLASAARRALSVFTPQPAYAAFIVGSVGGAVSELSPSVVIDMQSVNLAFVQPIADGRVSRPLADASGNALQVKVSTFKGTPLPGVTVTLEIAGNSSSIAFFKDGNAEASVSVSRVTGDDGIATFASPNVFLTKAGGYQVVAKGGFDGVNGVPFLSNSFNMQNK